jgi:hypothetical protein
MQKLFIAKHGVYVTASKEGGSEFETYDSDNSLMGYISGNGYIFTATDICIMTLQDISDLAYIMKQIKQKNIVMDGSNK